MTDTCAPSDVANLPTKTYSCQWQVVIQPVGQYGEPVGKQVVLSRWATRDEAVADRPNHGLQHSSVEGRWVPHGANGYSNLEIIYREVEILHVTPALTSEIEQEFRKNFPEAASIRDLANAQASKSCDTEVRAAWVAATQIASDHMSNYHPDGAHYDAAEKLYEALKAATPHCDTKSEAIATSSGPKMSYLVCPVCEFDTILADAPLIVGCPFCAEDNGRNVSLKRQNVDISSIGSVEGRDDRSPLKPA